MGQSISHGQSGLLALWFGRGRFLVNPGPGFRQKPSLPNGPRRQNPSGPPATPLGSRYNGKPHAPNVGARPPAGSDPARSRSLPEDVPPPPAGPPPPPRTTRKPRAPRPPGDRGLTPRPDCSV